MPDPTPETARAADALVADARHAVHEALIVLAAPEADRVRSLVADLETAVEGRTAIRFTNQPVVPPADQTAEVQVWRDDNLPPAAQLAAIRKRHAVLAARDWDTTPHQHGASGCRCLSCYDDPTGWWVDHPSALDCEELVATTSNDFGRKRDSCEAGPLLSYDEADALAHAAKDIGFLLDQVAAVLPATDRATETEPPLSPDYQHPECGFHWHGRDGMDIPMRDGQPVCPRCELRRLAGEAEQPEPAEPVRHAPGVAVLCPGCRAKSHAICMDDKGRPVPLAASCAYCGHRFDEHNRFGCHVGNQEVRCGCDVFVLGEKPAPVDPRTILGVDPDFQQPARAARQDPTPDGTLAAALDGLHTLIATSSRDWQTYRVDAWIWAVLCGWDCEKTEHDETCTHGALEETAALHGWGTDTVAKARRYRAAVRALTDPAVSAGQPGTNTEA
jgi:hypothetical protein